MVLNYYLLRLLFVIAITSFVVNRNRPKAIEKRTLRKSTLLLRTKREPLFQRQNYVPWLSIGKILCNRLCLVGSKLRNLRKNFLVNLLMRSSLIFTIKGFWIRLYLRLANTIEKQSLSGKIELKRMLLLQVLVKPLLILPIRGLMLHLRSRCKQLVRVITKTNLTLMLKERHSVIYQLVLEH